MVSHPDAMDGKDESQARGLKGMLARSRRGKDEPTGDRADSRSTRGDSSESVPEKFKPRPSVSSQGAGSENPHGAGRSKRKNKPARAGAEGGDSIPQTPTSTSLGASEGGSMNGSANDVDEGSTMTSDSEGERALAASRPRGGAPPLIDPNSHSGYLTSSSPQIKTSPVNPPSQNAISNMASGSALSVDSADSGQSKRSRSVSPGTKIKEALKSKKPKETNDPPKSEMDDTLAARRLSRATVEGVTSPTPLETYNAARNQSNKSLPSIVMTPETPPPLPHGLYDRMMASSYEKLPPLVNSPDPLDKHQGDDEQQRPNRSGSGSGSDKGSPSSFSSFSHRRARSDSQTTHPSRLSQSMNPPLTPMIEEIRTPPSSSRNPSASSGGGFFTSVFSAAQNAASSFTNTLSNPVNRPRSSASQHHPLEEEKSQEQQPDPEPVSEPPEPPAAANDSNKPLAIDTIGTGELSLSHLGISTEASPVPGGSSAPSTPAEVLQSRSRSGTVVRREEAAAREEGISAARAVSAAYVDQLEDAPTPMVEAAAEDRKFAPAEDSFIGDRTTPNGSVADGDSIIPRSNSLRKISSKRRNRGGSQSTIGAALAASGSTLISGTNNSSQRLAGFAVASKKRNRDFHALFRSVPEDDYLIEDYSCALQRDIILAGRIYISEGHVCFSSNILGWVTTLVISFDEVVSVEKESTAMVFPNAIAVQTLHARHTFRSLLSREATYDLLIGIWKINHPHLMSSENGVRVASGTGSKTEKLESNHSDNGSEAEGSEENDMDDENASEGSDDGQGSSVASGEVSAAALDVSASPPKSTIPKKPSNIGLAAGQAMSPPTVPDFKAAAQANGALIATGDFPGPPTHGLTECSDGSTHYPNVLKDEVIPAPLGKIYSMTFGNASGGFMSRWLLDEQKVLDLQMDDDKKGLADDNKTRSFSYIKPLGGSIGPKQTKCIITEQLDSFDLEKAVSVTVTTQTPDVPSGNVFSTKTRYCLMWGPNNGTRLVMTCVIEWTGKSWLKGPIEKGANDGQAAYATDLCKALRAAVSKGKPATGTPSKKKSKKRRPDAEKSTTSLATSSESKKSDWGLFEPLHGILGPVVDPLEPLLTVHTLVAVLSILLLYSWLLRGAPTTSSLPSRTGRAARMAAYEELWRSEEAALWTWLEQRIGGDEGIAVPVGASGRERMNADRSKLAQHERQQTLRGERGQFMSEQEVHRAVEITEEKLKGLKEAVQKAKGNAKPKEKADEL